MAVIELTDFSGGKNEQVGPHAIKDNEVVDAVNMFGEPGRIYQRPGILKWNTVADDNRPFKSMTKFYQVDGTAIPIVTATTKILKGDNTTKTLSEIQDAAMTSGLEFTFANVTNPGATSTALLLMANGTDAIRKWDGSGNTAALGGSPPVGSLVAWHKYFAFIAGQANKQRLDYSGLDDVESWPGNYVEIPFRSKADRIMWIIPFADELLIFGFNQLWSLVGDSPSDWYPKEYYFAPGTVRGRTVATSPFGVFWLAADGVYHLVGENATRISDNIKKSLAGIDFSTACGGYRDGKYFLTYRLTTDVETYAHRCLCYDVIYKAWWPIEGMYAGQFFLADNPDDDGLLYFADPRDTGGGYLYKYPYGTSDTSETQIISTMETTETWTGGSANTTNYDQGARSLRTLIESCDDYTDWSVTSDDIYVSLLAGDFYKDSGGLGTGWTIGHSSFTNEWAIIKCNSAGAYAYYDQSITNGKIIFTCGRAGYLGGPIFRSDKSNNDYGGNGYCVLAKSTVMTLNKVVNGALAQLGTYSGAIDSSDVLSVIYKGTSIKVYQGTTERISVTDETYSSGVSGLTGELIGGVSDINLMQTESVVLSQDTSNKTSGTGSLSAYSKAGTELNQYMFSAYTLSITSIANSIRYQTFTPDANGQVNRIRFMAGKASTFTDDITVGLYEVSAVYPYRPSLVALSSEVIANSSIVTVPSTPHYYDCNLIDVVFDTPIDVVAGTKYAWGVTYPSTSGLYIAHGAGYSGGSMFIYSDTWTETTANDRWFEAYVKTNKCHVSEDLGANVINLSNIDSLWLNLRSTAAGSFSFMFGEAAATEQSSTLTALIADTWSLREFDISAIANASKDVVKYLRVAMASAINTDYTLLIDSICSGLTREVTLDLSALADSDTFDLWSYNHFSTAVTLTLIFETSTGNYFSYVHTGLTAGVNNLSVAKSVCSETGTGDWSTITKIKIAATGDVSVDNLRVSPGSASSSIEAWAQFKDLFPSTKGRLNSFSVLEVIAQPASDSIKIEADFDQSRTYISKTKSLAGTKLVRTLMRLSRVGRCIGLKVSNVEGDSTFEMNSVTIATLEGRSLSG